MIYSYSRLKRYADCPSSFQYKYLMDMEEPITEPLVLGKAVHAAIQGFLSGIDRDNAIDEAMQKAELPLERAEVVKMVYHPRVSQVISGKVESHFVTSLDAEGILKFQGFIDWYDKLPDGSVHLIDWKTNRLTYKPLDNKQLGLYAWYLSRVYGVQEVHADLMFLRYSGANCTQSHLYTPGEMEESRTWAFQLANEIEDKTAEWSLQAGREDDQIFPARTGVHCQYCGYASVCVKNIQAKSMEIKNDGDARAVGAEVIRLEAALGMMKDQLKAWVKQNGDVIIDDSAFSYVPSCSWNIEPEMLYELCAQLHDEGVNVFEYLTLTAANLKKIGISEERVKLFGKKKVSKNFKLVKMPKAS